MIIKEAISRWWQSKGFGIQSKTDFAFLHDVIREENRYYAYDELQQAFPDASHKLSEDARLLYRILNRNLGKRIVIVGTLSAIELHACRISKAQPVIIDGVTHFHNIDILIAKDISTTNMEQWQRILQTECVTFDISGDIGIAIFQHGRFPQHYKI